jgi:glycosyltransferase involved in cell wall biosynthesis
MSHPDQPRVGYVLKRYPRYSETFIVNEILAHETAGLPLEIFSLRPPTDTFFPEKVDRVRAPLTYVPSTDVTAGTFWTAFDDAIELFGDLNPIWQLARDEELLIHDVFQAALLAVEARRRRIDHLHAHFASAAAIVARVAAKIAGITYSLTAHAKDIFHEDVRQADLDAKLHDAAGVVTVSDFNRDYLKRTFGSSAARVQRIYNGLDLNEFPFSGPSQRPPQIVAVGRLVEKKGFADLVDACALLEERGRAFSCQIIGAGELEADLRGRIASRNLAGSIELLGARAPSEVIAAIQDSAVVAAPCVVGEDGNRDGLPTVLLEAMALGTPCVSTEVTGIPELLRHEQTGLSVPERDPRALASAIERLLDDSALRVRLATHARRRIEQDFDIHRNTAKMRALFRDASRLSTPAVAELQEVG